MNDGDTDCLANQRLRLQTQDPIEVTADAPVLHAVADGRPLADQLGGRSIEVPIVPRRRLAGRADRRRLRLDAVAVPEAARRQVHGARTACTPARSIPTCSGTGSRSSTSTSRSSVPDPGRVAPIAPIIYPQILGAGTPTPPLPADRFDGITDYGQALALFESDPHVRVLMENGAGSSMPGLPAPTFELGFSKWPPREVPADRVVLRPGRHPDARQAGAATATSTAIAPIPTRARGRPCRRGSADSWALLPPYDWRPLRRRHGRGLRHRRRSTDDVTIVGPGSVDLWLRSSAPDTDLQVTLSEIRPDGFETYVQSGWLRASHAQARHASARRASSRGRRTSSSDARPLPAGKFTKVRVGLFAAAHVVPRRLAHPHQRRGPGRRPHALGVRHAVDRRDGAERDRAHAVATVPADARRRARRPGSADAAAVPGPSRPAVPDLRAGGERRLAGPPLSR